MKKVLFFVIEPWTDWELNLIAAATYELGNGACVNKVVSFSTDPVRSHIGIKCLPDYDLSSIPQNYDAMIFIGSEAWRKDENIASAAVKLSRTVEDCLKRGRILGAIGDACRLLSYMGALNNSLHTANRIDDLKQYSTYTNERGFVLKSAVFDKFILTANGRGTLEFAAELSRALSIAPDRRIKEWYNFQKPLYFYSEV